MSSVVTLAAHELRNVASASPWASTIAALRCLRGIDTLSAIGLCAETGDVARFEHPDALACYFGLVPSENSSGEKRRQGRDHQGRLDARPATADRGRLA